MSADRKRSRRPLRDRLFHLGISLKLLDGVIETVGGIMLWIIGPGSIVNWIFRITQVEINEDRNDFVSTHLRHAATHISLAGQHFIAVYLFLHGVVKIVVVLALFRNKLWAYPLALVVFGGFVVYQVYRFTETHAVGLIVLSVFDLAVLWLIWMEYRAAKTRGYAMAKAG
jgi:uncharacterized membrane protein